MSTSPANWPHVLNAGLATGRCAGLVLVASNPFLGELKEHLDTQSRQRVLRTVPERLHLAGRTRAGAAAGRHLTSMPSTARRPAMMKLLIAIDGSDHARRAIEAAGQLAEARSRRSMRCSFMCAKSPAYYGELPPFDFQSIESGLRQRQAELLESRARAGPATAACNRDHAGGRRPGRAGDRAPGAERGVDCIVMGTRGMNALGGLLLGSVAQRVVHLASVPVMLVK
jgi:nucleotide-binding universal stress UspA family protein